MGAAAKEEASSLLLRHDRWRLPAPYTWRMLLPRLAGALAVLGVLGAAAYFICTSPPYVDPEYSLAVAVADGLDGADLRRPAVSPVLDLAFSVWKPEDQTWHVCVGGEHRRLAVSYAGAVLAGQSGPLSPEVCLGQAGGRSWLNVTAWGVDVALPRFLRERLAAELERGEAALDVKMIPDAPLDWLQGREPVLACKAKIGQGLFPCKFVD